MKLSELEKYNSITIQCHDNPDADALASGFGLYTYFKRKGKEVRLIYMGRNQIQKANLTMMVNELQIPIEYLESEGAHIKGLLVTVDCQYGAGNVTYLSADEVAVIDHHHVEKLPALGEIRSSLGSCSTLVWYMMKKEGFCFEKERNLCTALYYGLFSDTNQFSEICNPLDMDMRDNLIFDKKMISRFKNSNLSLEEMETAGMALMGTRYHALHRYAIVEARPCDPNILGLISDFLLQVDKVDTCVVYNKMEDGIKFSIRSCVKEVRANELAAYLGEKVGSGGGHSEKAGGFIPIGAYKEKYGQLPAEEYFMEKLNWYFENCIIIYAEEYQMELQDAQLYRKKKLSLGFVRLIDIYDIGTSITLRTLNGDRNMTVTPDKIVMIGIAGEVHVVPEEEFQKEYIATSEKYDASRQLCNIEYAPTIRKELTGEVSVLTDYAYVCVPDSEVKIYALELEKPVKIFATRQAEGYRLGKPGDFLAVQCGSRKNIHVIGKEIFDVAYEKAL